MYEVSHVFIFIKFNRVKYTRRVRQSHKNGFVEVKIENRPL